MERARLLLHCFLWDLVRLRIQRAPPTLRGGRSRLITSLAKHRVLAERSRARHLAEHGLPCLRQDPWTGLAQHALDLAAAPAAAACAQYRLQPLVLLYGAFPACVLPGADSNAYVNQLEPCARLHPSAVVILQESLVEKELCLLLFVTTFSEPWVL